MDEYEYIPRNIVHAFSSWNHNIKDDTYNIKINGKVVKISSRMASEVGVFIQSGMPDMAV